MNIKDAYGYQEFKDFAKEIERDFTFETPECAESSHAYLREEREYWGIVYGKIGGVC